MNLIITDRDDEDEEESNKQKDKENKDKDQKKNKREPKPFAQWIKLLYKTYLISIVQLALIEILLIFGFYFKLNNIFFKNLGLKLGILIPISIICGIFSLFFFLYSINDIIFFLII